MYASIFGCLNYLFIFEYKNSRNQNSNIPYFVKWNSAQMKNAYILIN